MEQWKSLLVVAAVAALAACFAGIIAVCTAPSDQLRTLGGSGKVTPCVGEDLFARRTVVANPDRRVPPGIRRTATVFAAPWAPGVRLKAVRLRSPWQARRALLEDRTTGDVRSYAIGDLLPHGSLLVGISTGAVELVVGDEELIRLFDDGEIRSVMDFRKAWEGEALTPVRDLDSDFRETILTLLVMTESEENHDVQFAIDELIAAGEPAIEIILPYVRVTAPVVGTAEYAFPSGSARILRPRVVGDIVIIALEEMTGQTFGDVTKERLKPHQREVIADQWLRWWGLDSP